MRRAFLTLSIALCLTLGGLPGPAWADGADAMLQEGIVQFKVGKFPFSASGKAVAAGHPEGFVKMIFDARYGELLGTHIIGAEATELIAEAGLGRALETTEHELIKTVHAHPTMSEALMEAAAVAYGESVNF